MFWIIYVVATVVGVIVLDQVSKALIVKYLLGGQYVLVPRVLQFTYVENRGMAFGLLADHRWVFLLLATAGLALVGFYLYRFARTRLARVALALVVGGGIGNMIDRLSLGYVIDFIDFCAFPSVWGWVFNVADAAVCVGVVLFILDLILELVRDAKQKKAADGAKNAPDTAPEQDENA